MSSSLLSVAGGALSSCFVYCSPSRCVALPPAEGTAPAIYRHPRSAPTPGTHPGTSLHLVLQALELCKSQRLGEVRASGQRHRAAAPARQQEACLPDPVCPQLRASQQPAEQTGLLAHSAEDTEGRVGLCIHHTKALWETACVITQ